MNWRFWVSDKPLAVTRDMDGEMRPHRRLLIDYEGNVVGVETIIGFTSATPDGRVTNSYVVSWQPENEHAKKLYRPVARPSAHSDVEWLKGIGIKP